MASRKPRSSTEERLAREEQLRQQQLPRMEFSERHCMECGGGALPISSTELPAIMGTVNGSVSKAQLVRAARQAGFTADHCYTSLAGVSICGKREVR